MMRTRTSVALVVVAAAAAIAAGAVVIFSPSVSQSRSAGDHVVSAGSHAGKATERGSGRTASMIVTDPYAAGSKLRKVEYHLHDGYTKRVIIPGGAYVAAEDIAICGTSGQHYPNNGFTGTGLQCKPFLHTTEVFYHQHTG